MDWIGDPNRRCRSCKKLLTEVGFKPYWHQCRDWRTWSLRIRCGCGKCVGVVAKANMPEDPSLIPPRPDISKQRELCFGDAGSEGAEGMRYLAEDAAKAR